MKISKLLLATLIASSMACGETPKAEENGATPFTAVKGKDVPTMTNCTIPPPEVPAPLTPGNDSLTPPPAPRHSDPEGCPACGMG